ncbi:MAG: hypothetical protein IPK80_35625 [Nannocystis sp.]|nr:hypothetical protein [Nannocystis sp.]
MLRSAAHLRMSALGVVAAGAACVLPLDPLTGVEIAWTLRERDASDGEGERRLRSCAGARLDEVELHVRDLDDPARARAFTFDCEEGAQTPEELTAAAARVFLDLRPGAYELTVTARGRSPGVGLMLAQPLEIDERGVTLTALELAPALVPFEITLEIAQPPACASFRARLLYDSPQAALVLAEGAAIPALYRAGLRSDRGLDLGGGEQSCADLEAGTHRLLLDPGAYFLAVELDGRTCEIPIEAGGAQSELVLALEKLPCAG